MAISKSHLEFRKSIHGLIPEAPLAAAKKRKVLRTNDNGACSRDAQNSVSILRTNNVPNGFCATRCANDHQNELLSRKDYGSGTQGHQRQLAQPYWESTVAPNTLQTHLI